jgi:aspartyl-tRNA synthetase
MSFANEDSVMNVIERLIKTIWQNLLNIELPPSFPRMSYNEAMARYGSDKPDLTLGMEVSRCTDVEKRP